MTQAGGVYSSTIQWWQSPQAAIQCHECFVSDTKGNCGGVILQVTEVQGSSCRSMVLLVPWHRSWCSSMAAPQRKQSDRTPTPASPPLQHHLPLGASHNTPWSYCGLAAGADYKCNTFGSDCTGSAMHCRHCRIRSTTQKKKVWSMA